jgi:biopolymer transport protein TolR
MGMSQNSTTSINVTPLIDILLVLLIIFLVLLPIMARIETVELPPKAPDEVIVEEVPTLVKLHGDLTISIDDSSPMLSSDLPVLRGKRMPKTVFVDASSTVPWSEVVSLVDRIRGLADNPELVQVAVRIHDSDAALP